MLFSQLFTDPIVFFIQTFVLVYAITIHEFAHVLAAKLQGDDTGEQLGRLTLNPLAHLDPIGTLLIFFMGLGWGKPAPYNPNHLSDRKWGPVWVGLSGPLSNILSGVVFAYIARFLVLFGLVSATSTVIFFFYLLSLLNFAFTFFNLIPIPPLDGSKLLLALIPDSQYKLKHALETRGNVLFIFLMMISIASGLHIFGFIWTLGEMLTRAFVGFGA